LPSAARILIAFAGGVAMKMVVKSRSGCSCYELVEQKASSGQKISGQMLCKTGIWHLPEKICLKLAQYLSGASSERQVSL
jgi:hypothetical protein